MKSLSFILFPAILLASCTSNMHTPATVHTAFVPYNSRYPAAPVKDTLLAGHAWVKYFVSTDTADATLYIRYGDPGFDSVFKQPNGLPGGCDTWEYTYRTDRVIALGYDCTGEHRLVLLPLNHRDNIRIYSPLFIGEDDSLVLVEDDTKKGSHPPALIAADLDMNRRQPFRMDANVPCTGDILACFDTIYFRKKIILQYNAGNESGETSTRIQEQPIPWKR